MASAVATRDQDPSLRKLLALEALTFDDRPTYQSTTVLHQVLAADPVIARGYQWPADRGGHPGWTQLSPSGDLMIAGNGFNYFEVADPRTGSVAWSYPGDGQDGVGASYFSADDSDVIVGLTQDDDNDAEPSNEPALDGVP